MDRKPIAVIGYNSGEVAMEVYKSVLGMSSDLRHEYCRRKLELYKKNHTK